MKTKNVVVLGAILFALYYLLKNKKGDNFQEMGDGNPLDNGQADLDAVVDGNEPPSISAEDKKVLFTQALGYRGGARPTAEMEAKANKLREQALAKIKAYGLMEEFKKFKVKQKSKGIPVSVPKDKLGNIRLDSRPPKGGFIVGKVSRS